MVRPLLVALRRWSVAIHAVVGGLGGATWAFGSAGGVGADVPLFGYAPAGARVVAVLDLAGGIILPVTQAFEGRLSLAGTIHQVGGPLSNHPIVVQLDLLS